MTQEHNKQETASENGPSREATEPTRIDAERVDEAAQAIAQAFIRGSNRFWEAQVEATQPKSRLIRSITFAASTWVVFFAIGSAFTLLAGWIIFDVQPLHTLERIGREQEQAGTKAHLADFHVNLGNSLINVGRVEQAQTEFEKALEIEPLNSDAQKGMVECDLFLAIQKVNSSNSDPAVLDEKLNALINEDSSALNPDSSRLSQLDEKMTALITNEDSSAEDLTQIRLSQLYAFQGDYFYYYKPDLAVDSYKTAIALNEDNAVAYSGLSTNYYERGKFDLAEENAGLAWKAAKWDTILEANYADTLLANGRYDMAWELYSDVNKWDPNYVWAYHNAATTARLQGDLGQWYRVGDEYVRGSQGYYEELIRLLKDKQIMSMDRNKGAASFTIGTTGPMQWKAVYLTNPSEQQYYALYGLALTLHLQGHKDKAENFVNEANDLNIDPNQEKNIKWLVQYDIGKLQKEQEQLSDDAGEFSAKFLYP